MRRDDASHARAALGHLAVLREHAAAIEVAESLRLDATCMRLAAAIEDASRMSDAARETAFGDAWPAMWSTRNRITHGYAYVRADVIEATVANDLAEFEDALRLIAGIPG